MNGKKIPLRLQINNKNNQEKVLSAVYVNETVQVKPFSVKHFQGRLPEVQARTMPNGDGIVSGDDQFMDKTDLHPWTGTVVTCSEPGLITIGAMNTTDQTITIPYGTRYGSFKLTTSMEEEKKQPWRICVLEKPKKTAQPSSDEAQQEPWMTGPTDKSNKVQRMEYLVNTFQLQQSPHLLSEDSLQKSYRTFTTALERVQL